jgi:hypothetical protein
MEIIEASFIDGGIYLMLVIIYGDETIIISI